MHIHSLDYKLMYIKSNNAILGIVAQPQKTCSLSLACNLMSLVGEGAIPKSATMMLKKHLYVVLFCNRFVTTSIYLIGALWVEFQSQDMLV